MIALLSWRLWAALALAVILAVSHLSAYRAGRQAVTAKWDAAKVASVQAAQEQAERNHELQRKSEIKYVVQAQTREPTVAPEPPPVALLMECPQPDKLPDVASAREGIEWGVGWARNAACERARSIGLLGAWPK